MITCVENKNNYSTTSRFHQKHGHSQDLVTGTPKQQLRMFYLHIMSYVTWLMAGSDCLLQGWGSICTTSHEEVLPNENKLSQAQASQPPWSCGEPGSLLCACKVKGLGWELFATLPWGPAVIPDTAFIFKLFGILREKREFSLYFFT